MNGPKPNRDGFNNFQSKHFYETSLYPSIFQKTLDEEAFIYALTTDEVIKILRTDKDTGLTSVDAKKLIEVHGQNKLQEKSNFNIFKIFFSQFKDFLALLLFIAMIAGYLTGQPIIGDILFLLILFNATAGFIQEYRAEKTMEALANMIPKKIEVIRDSKLQTIDSIDLVPGDIIILQAGTDIPADCRLIEANYLECQEASITGENVPRAKTVDEHEKKILSIFDVTNLVFMGTSVSSGSGKAVVVGTGMNTEFGKIAQSAQITKKDKSPLQKELFLAGEYLIIIALVVAIIAFSINFFYAKDSFNVTLILALGLAVGVVPEGLPSTVTAALAFAVKKLARKNVVVKRLTSTETLGSCNVIVTDKTGTLTKNEMTVKKIFFFGINLLNKNKDFKNQDFADVTGVGYSYDGEIKIDLSNKKSNNILSLLLKSSTLCNNSEINYDHSKNKYTVVGDPLEGALLSFSGKIDKNFTNLKKQYIRVKEVPFDARRKMMSVIVKYEGKNYVFTKGAMENVLKISKDTVFLDKKMDLDPKLKKELFSKEKDFSKNTLRVIAFAYKEITGDIENLDPKDIESDLTFIGITGIQDPPREDVYKAILDAKNAGIKVIMCTGDSPETALAIGKMINIADSDTTIITGTQMKNMPHQDLENILKEGNVIFARTTPLGKLNIVKILQKQGNIVAVTGDGVNDAPALKAADIGVAMGITGTDAAKESADLILLDDSFSSVVYAISEGRQIYDNIKKFIRFVVTIDIAEMMTIFIGSLFLFPPVMYVLQILTIDLIVNIIPSLILSSDLPDPDIMDRPPRNKKNHLFDKETLVPVLMNGTIIAILAVIIFYIVYHTYNNYFMATTAAYSTLVFAQIGNFLSSRSYKYSIFSFKLLSYSKIFIGIFTIILFQSLFIFLPFFNAILHTYPLKTNIIFYYIFVIFLLIMIEEVRKLIIRRI
jgi:Ca2+-transporting ATPase